jgi:hypothetical protein
VRERVRQERVGQRGGRDRERERQRVQRRDSAGRITVVKSDRRLNQTGHVRSMQESLF